MDRLTKKRRSWLMSRVGSTNTLPERLVRSELHKAGFRFALHSTALPGKPDIVLTRRRAIVFVHGCFWHRHPNCAKASLPKSNRPFWCAKFERNVARDLETTRALRALGWKVFVVWSCQAKRDSRRIRELAAALRMC